MTEGRFVVSTCHLNQWSLDFVGNRERILKSIILACEAGSHYRCGPEFEICGLDIGDHIYEPETMHLCWTSVHEILTQTANMNIIIDLGMPVIFDSGIYNARVICSMGKIICIVCSPTAHLLPYIKPWKNKPQSFSLQKSIFGENLPPVPIGSDPFKIELPGKTTIQIMSMSTDHEDIMLSETPCHLFINSRVSRYELKSSKKRREQYKEMSAKNSNKLFVTATMIGTDSGKHYYEGGSAIYLGGQECSSTPLYDLADLHVACFEINPKNFVSNSTTYKELDSTTLSSFPLSDEPQCASTKTNNLLHKTSQIKEISTEEEEIGLVTSSWLWDYLRKSGTNGFFLPLSGGIDSGSTLACVVIMCRRLWQDKSHYESIRSSLMKTFDLDENELAKIHCSSQLTNRMLSTAYMGSNHSSKQTLNHSERLANEAQSYHMTLNIQMIITAFTSLIASAFGMPAPKFKSQGGSHYEDLALQNLQARIRMVLAYFIAGLLPWKRGLTSPKRPVKYLVLGTGNNDECLTGYFTKYDCSSADLNPIGSLSKSQLRRFALWAAETHGLPTLTEIAKAPPTAELRPPDKEGVSQTDEQDLGVTYEQIGILSTLRKVHRLGPVVSLYKFAEKYKGTLELVQIKNVIKRFFERFCVHRHKMCVMTPSLHIDARDCEPHVHDRRPMIYPNLQPYLKLLEEADPTNDVISS